MTKGHKRKPRGHVRLNRRRRIIRVAMLEELAKIPTAIQTEKRRARCAPDPTPQRKSRRYRARPRRIVKNQEDFEWDWE